MVGKLKENMSKVQVSKNGQCCVTVPRQLAARFKLIKGMVVCFVDRHDCIEVKPQTSETSL